MLPLAERKSWKNMKEKEKRILETFIVEKAQLQNMIDFFCYGEIFDELMNHNECCIEGLNKSSIKIILDHQMSNYVVTLKKISINIENKFEELYWYCLSFGLDIKFFQTGIYYIKHSLIDGMTDNKFYKDPKLILHTLYENLCILKKIEKECEILSTELD